MTAPVSTIYLSAAALDQLDEAQHVIDQHARIDLSGHCWVCHEVPPCTALIAGNNIFARYGRSSSLPHRLPPLIAFGQLDRVA